LFSLASFDSRYFDTFSFRCLIQLYHVLQAVRQPSFPEGWSKVDRRSSRLPMALQATQGDSASDRDWRSRSTSHGRPVRAVPVSLFYLLIYVSNF